MKATQAPIPLAYVATPKSKLLVGRVSTAIPVDSFLVFRKVEDAYEIQVVVQSGDTSDPQALASFLDPADVDAGELLHAACLAFESTAKPKPKRKPKSKTPATTTKGLKK
jgi:hypothetical protein